LQQKSRGHHYARFIETRLGTLKVFDGFPDDATSKRSWPTSILIAVSSNPALGQD
jgi:hypothetical protein